MEANELRVGNILNYEGNYSNYKGQIELSEGLFKYLLDVQDEWHLLKPITLTEEWLLKLGAKNTAPFEYQLDILGEEYIISKYGSVNGSDKGYVIDYDFKAKRIKYVHEFQNRIFSLTGEELQIK